MKRHRLGRALRGRYGHAFQRKVCGEYHTRTGKVGALIHCSMSDRGTTYSYIGAWGAGSGHSAADMRKEIAYWRANKRGMREVIPFSEGGA